MPEPDQPKTVGPASRLNQLLTLAAKVLTSHNPEASDTLERNIRYLAHAVELEERLISIEERLKSVEKRFEQP